MDALFDFVVLIKDFIISLIAGLEILLSAFRYILTVQGTSLAWMPSFVSAVIPVALILIVVLRIVGR